MKSVTDSTFEDSPAEGIHADRWKRYFNSILLGGGGQNNPPPVFPPPS